MIPADQIDRRAYSVLTQYLRHELTTALGERRPLEEKWLRYHRMYKSQPEQRVKQFPFAGAANLVVPVSATDVDTIFSRLIGILFGPENLWSCNALRDDAVEYAPRLQEFLKWAQRNELRVYPSVTDWLLELCKLGTGVLKQRYRRESRPSYEFRETPEGPVEQFSRLMTFDNPVLEHVSLYDFLVPTGAVDHQESAWCAERVMLTWQQLEQRERAGVYTNLPALRASFGRDRGSWVRQEIESLNNVRAGLSQRIELWETWLDFDIRGAGEPQAIVMTLHLPSMTPVRIDYNPFFHQERPFEAARYLRQEKQFYGIGIPEMLEMFQEEVTAMHNQRIDAGSIANAPMMKARQGIGIKEDEPIFIGRWMLVKEMDDIQPLTFGRPPLSTIGDEQMTMGYATRRTGVNDYVMGNSSAAVGYATAQTNIMQHQEAAKRFDQTLREVRAALGASGRRIVELYQQFDSRGKEFTVLGEKDGAIVQQILQFPLELIRHSVSVEVTATSAQLNKETQIRTNTILMQLIAQFYEQMFQGMLMVTNPQLPEPLRALAIQMVVSGGILMRRLLDSYDVQDIDRIVPDMQELISGQAQQLQQLGAPGPGLWPEPSQQAIGPGGGGGPAGALQQPGMAPLLPGA